MSRAFEDSTLWRSAFGSRSKDRLADDRKSLELAYRQFREGVLPLLRQTAIDLPALTVHDETHVDQLWDVASEICGEAYPLNPLEGLILGGAFLLHDAALCLAAYEGSISGLLQSDEWNDSVVRLWRAHGVEQPSADQRTSPPDDIKNAAIFEVLRTKHAHQASRLLDRTWPHPTTGRPISLLDNNQLNEDYGPLIGLIAASHHWHIKLVEDTFVNVIPASSRWPREWQVDPLKLACILRCADAAAIDERRAPSRLFALKPPSGTSRRHWAFQNKMYPPRLEDETLVFFSKIAFGLDAMDDWWLCYDAANIVDEELRASNALLAAHRRPPFSARQVFGARIAEDFCKKVLVSGWTPVETSLRITDIPSIVSRLGGTKLYGEDPEALLREMIQNAADAIRARRRRDHSFAAKGKYPGKIKIRTRIEADTVHFFIEDDGLGMPAAVLTGPLLDFGTSFWNSELAAVLYPGLQGDTEFRPSGKYGIGFFAAFMFSNRVTVISKPFAKGRDDYLVLAFERGLSGRSQLRKYDPHIDGELGANVSTIIKTQLPLDRLTRSLQSFAQANQSRFSLHKLLSSQLSQLCFALDVYVSLEWEDGTSTSLNTPHYRDWTNEEFVVRLDQTFGREGAGTAKHFASCVEPLINDDGRFCGRGYVSPGFSARIPIRATDGFARTNPGYVIGTGDLFEGVVEERPVIASRRLGELTATPTAWKKWASRQLEHLTRERSNLSGEELYFAACRLAELGVDVSSIAHCYLVDRYAPIADCIDILRTRGQIAFLAKRQFSFVEEDARASRELAAIGDFCRSVKDGDGELVHSLQFIQSRSFQLSFEDFSDDLEDTQSNNVLAYFLKLLNKQGLSYAVSFKARLPIGEYSGYSTNSIKDGDTLYCSAVLVALLDGKASQ